jgi:outer membrane protein TolC
MSISHHKTFLYTFMLSVCLATHVISVFGADTNREDAASIAIMTLDDSLRYGLTNNPSMRKALKEGEVAEARIGQALSLALPNLSVNATYSRLGEVDTFDLGDGPIPLGNEDNYNVTFGASQLLFSGGQVSAALRSANITRGLAFAGYSEAANALIRDIRVGFYDVLLANAAQDVQEASYRQIEGLLEQTERRHASDAASDFELLTAKVRLANEAPRSIAVRNDAELAATAFTTLLHHSVPVVATGALEQADIMITETQMLALAMEQRPVIQASALRMQLA